MAVQFAGGSRASTQFMVSMVVDWLDAHPYQAEMLLLMLEEIAGIQRHQLVVQCTNRVSAEVVAAFRARGYVVTTIAPYLDRAYCNKIAQLDHFLDADAIAHGVKGLLLLDLDVGVLAPLEIPDADVVLGKVVDAPNPPLKVIRQAFAEAGVPLPEVIPCDWKELGETVATNFNGGVLYIPCEQIPAIRQEWRHWAQWLHDDSSILKHPSERKHTDQLSLALALASRDIPWRHFSSNWNFPGGSDAVPSRLQPSEPVRVLHYHLWRLDNFGLIAPPSSATDALKEAVARINAMVSKHPMTFFERFRGERAREAASQVPAMNAGLFSEEFVAREALRGGRRRRLVLHGGLPKTGTSSLQWHLSNNRQALAEIGVWYPKSAPPPFEPPKHQPLVAMLLIGDLLSFARYVETVLHDMPDDTHTVILSAEGISNHWWDFPPQSKEALRRLAELFDFELCLFFREPASFAAAFWAQSIINPTTTGHAAQVNGRDVSLKGAMEDEWFRRHLDYLGLLLEAKLLFGNGRVCTLPYQRDIVNMFLHQYGIPELPYAPKRRNATLGRLGVSMVRLLNRRAISKEYRVQTIRWIRLVDRLAIALSGPIQLSAEDLAQIEQVSTPGWRAVQTALAAAVRKNE